jgi:hypothetical protein
MHSFVWIFRYRIQSKAKAKSHPLSEIKKWHSRSRATEKHTAPIVATQFLTVTENAKVESAFLPKSKITFSVTAEPMELCGETDYTTHLLKTQPKIPAHYFLDDDAPLHALRCRS